MVTFEELHGHLVRRPFVPFKVVLRTGEVVEVVRVAQAVVMRHRLVVGIDEKWRDVWLRDIDHVESAEAKAA